MRDRGDDFVLGVVNAAVAAVNTALYAQNADHWWCVGVAVFCALGAIDCFIAGNAGGRH